MVLGSAAAADEYFCTKKWGYERNKRHKMAKKVHTHERTRLRGMRNVNKWNTHSRTLLVASYPKLSSPKCNSSRTAVWRVAVHREHPYAVAVRCELTHEEIHGERQYRRGEQFLCRTLAVWDVSHFINHAISCIFCCKIRLKVVKTSFLLVDSSDFWGFKGVGKHLTFELVV